MRVVVTRQVPADDQRGAAAGESGVVWEAKVRQLRQDEREELHLASASGARFRARAVVGPVVCVGCGGTIAEVLSRLGSTRCHDCRDGVPPRNEVDSTRAAGTPPAQLSPARALLVRIRTRPHRLRRLRIVTREAARATTAQATRVP
jgi:hypothetical protein